jgi:hypothetical protein
MTRVAVANKRAFARAKTDMNQGPYRCFGLSGIASAARAALARPLCVDPSDATVGKAGEAPGVATMVGGAARI